MDASNFRLLAVVPLLAPRLSPPRGPQTNAEAIVGAKVVKGLLDSGTDLCVVSYDQDGARVDDSSLWNGLESCVQRIPDTSRGSIFSRLQKAAKHRVTNWVDWIDQVTNYAVEQHRRSPFTAVYSRSLPSAAHMAGQRISRLLHLPWVANINDPWGPSITPGYDEPVNWIERQLTIFWLRRTLRQADLVTYPSHRLGMLHRRVSGVEHRMEIIPHIGYRAENRATPDRFVLMHVGNLVVGRSGKLLLQAFLRFLEEEPGARSVSSLVFVGRTDAELERWLAEHSAGQSVRFTGSVNYERSLEHMASATVLVLIERGYEEGVFLPSKFCDYLASGKPVLALSPSVGTISDLAGKHRGVLVADPDSELSIRQAIGKLFCSWSKKRMAEVAPDPELTNLVCPQNTTKQLLNAIGRVAEEIRNVRMKRKAA